MAIKKKQQNEADILSGELERLRRQTAELDLSGRKAQQRKKKRIVLLSVLTAMVLLSALIGTVIYLNGQSEVSWGPNVAASERTEEKTEAHEKRLKKMDAAMKENEQERQGLCFAGYDAFFDDEGNLIVDGYFRNFTGHEVYNITGNVTVTTPNEDNVGAAYFEFPEKEFGSLKSGKSRPWRLIFEDDYVNVNITNLSKFNITTEFEYYQK